MSQTTTPILFLTRPKPDSERFLAALGPIRADVVVSPLVGIEPVPHGPVPAVQALILTSANAAHALEGAGLGGQTAYCVGARTAAAAGAVGLEAVSADGAADDLVRLILDKGEPGPLTYVRGQQVSTDLAAALGAQGLHVSEVIVYRQVNVTPTKAARTALGSGRLLICPVFSAASFARLLSILPKSMPKLTFVGISDAVFRSFPPTDDQKRCIAVTPDLGGMVTAVRATVSDG